MCSHFHANAHVSFHHELLGLGLGPRHRNRLQGFSGEGGAWHPCVAAEYRDGPGEL